MKRNKTAREGGQTPVLHQFNIPENTVAYLVQIPGEEETSSSSQSTELTFNDDNGKMSKKTKRRTLSIEDNDPSPTRKKSLKKVSIIEPPHTLVYPVTFDDYPNKLPVSEGKNDVRKRSSSPKKLMIVLKTPKVDNTDSSDSDTENINEVSRSSKKKNTPPEQIRKESNEKKHKRSAGKEIGIEERIKSSKDQSRKDSQVKEGDEHKKENTHSKLHDLKTSPRNTNERKMSYNDNTEKKSGSINSNNIKGSYKTAHHGQRSKSENRNSSRTSKNLRSTSAERLSDESLSSQYSESNAKNHKKSDEKSKKHINTSDDDNFTLENIYQTKLNSYIKGTDEFRNSDPKKRNLPVRKSHSASSWFSDNYSYEGRSESRNFSQFDQNKANDKREKDRSKKREQSHYEHRTGKRDNHRNSNPPLDQNGLKAKPDSIIDEQAKEVKKKDEKRQQSLRESKKDSAEKKRKPEKPIRYSHSNDPPLERDALIAKLENIIGEQAKEIQKKDAMLHPEKKMFIPYEPAREKKPETSIKQRKLGWPEKSPTRKNSPNKMKSQSKPGGDAEVGRSKRKQSPDNVRSKAPRTKTHMYAMKRYHIQIPEKGRRETPFLVRFNINDENSVDMVYSGPVKIKDYYSTNQYY